MIPVLVVNGPVGVGKSTIAAAASYLLEQAGIASAVVDLPELGRVRPGPAGDPWGERLIHRNLASVWAEYRAAGAQRLIVTRVLEADSLLRRIEDAVPGAAIAVARLRAPLEVVESRIRKREAGDASWYLEAARVLVDRLDDGPAAEVVVENLGPPLDVAGELLRGVGWLP